MKIPARDLQPDDIIDNRDGTFVVVRFVTWGSGLHAGYGKHHKTARALAITLDDGRTVSAHPAEMVKVTRQLRQ